MGLWDSLRGAWLRPYTDEVAPAAISNIAEPFVQRELHRYDPDIEVYGSSRNPVESARAEFLGFPSAAREGRANLTVSAIAYDGRREVLQLSPAETAAYIECDTVDARRAYRFARIRERRAQIAREAANKLQNGAALASLRPAEEAALHECAVLDENGRLREDFASTLDAAIKSPYLDQEWLPYGQGPLGYQLYLADMWEQLAKAWWAWHHDPLAKQGVNIIVTFVLAGGIQIRCDDEQVQAAVDEFWTRETMDLRLRAWLTDLGRDGELFARLIPDGTGRMRGRSLDPTTIWEIVTDAEDIERVYAYAQRYMTRTQLVTLPGIEPQRYIERELTPDEVIHIKINATSSEVRGRSDLFAILGYLKRLRDYFTSEVLKAQAAAAYHRDVSIDGSDADVQAFAAAEALQGPPQPGETWYHNKTVEISMVQGGMRSPVGRGSIYAGLVNMIAIGLGISKEYLGVTEHASLASAEISKDPAFQTFEVRQQLVRDFVERLVRRVIKEAVRFGRVPSDAKTGFGVVFRGLRQEDKSKKIERLAIGEGMGWWSKRTAANLAAPEADVVDFDFDSEQDEIAAEKSAVILKTYEQVPKGYPTPTQPAFAPGSVVNPNGGAAPSSEAREIGIVIIP